MEEFTSSVSPKGQITLPMKLRRQLGIKPKDRVSMRLEDGAVSVRPDARTLNRVFGSVEPATRTEEFAQVEQVVQEERAVREGRHLPRR